MMGSREGARLQRSPGEGLDRKALRRPRRPRRRHAPRSRRSVLLLVVMALFMLGPLSPASASVPQLPNPLNDACSPADHPAPEQYGSGTDGMIKPPEYPNEKLQKTPVEKLTYYDRYGTAGQTWYAVDMGCSDAMSMMGNAIANTVFTLVRTIDRTTISVYQAAASESLLTWLKDTVDGVITNIGKTFNARYWSWVVILGAMWLAWWGLVRRRASKVTEGVIWMVAAMVALTWLITRPADFTTLGTKVSEATSAAFSAALPPSDTKGGTCIPVPEGKPDPATSKDIDATSRNANALWVALVCKPWLQGEFGTSDPNAKIIKQNADKLLWSQAVDLPETYGTNKVDLGKKSDAYKDVTKDIHDNHPQNYALFQGKDWQNRLGVSLIALFAALVAGLLILVIALALIVVKIAFLLLLVAGPIFLGIGIHPGVGRVVAIRWLELLLSMLLKTGGAHRGALAAAVGLQPDPRGDAALGSAGGADRAGDVRGVRVPQAVPAPVRLRRLLGGRGARQGRGGTRQVDRGGPQEHRGDAAGRRLPDVPQGQERPGDGRRPRRRRDGRRGGGHGGRGRPVGARRGRGAVARGRAGARGQAARRGRRGGAGAVQARCSSAEPADQGGRARRPPHGRRQGGGRQARRRHRREGRR